MKKAREKPKSGVLKEAMLLAGFGCIAAITVVNAPIATLFICLLFLVALNYWLSRDVLHPAFAFCTIWLIAVTAHILSPIVIDPPTWSAVSIFVGGAAAFSLGCALGNRRLIKGQTHWLAQTTNPQPRRLLLLYSCATLPLFLRDTIRLAGEFTLSSQFIISARDALINASADESAYSNKIVSTAPMVSILCAWLFLMEDRNRFLKLVTIILVFTMCLLSTGRNMLLQFLVGWSVIAFLRATDRSVGAMKSKAIAIVVIVITLLMSISLITKHETQSTDAFQAARDIAITDIAGSLPAFSYGMKHPDMMNQGKSAHGTFVNVPFPTNVYTFYQNIYLRAGALGCIFVAFVVGLVHGLLFDAAKRGNRVAQFCMAYLYYALALSIFTDAYALIVRHLEVLMFGILYFGVLRRLPRMSLWPNLTLEAVRH